MDVASLWVCLNRINSKETVKMNAKRIVEVVAGHYGVSTADMLSASRDEKIVTARLVALYLTHRGTTASLPEIAYAFNRSHVAVLHAVGVVSQRIERDAMFRFEVEQLLRQTESKCS